MRPASAVRQDKTQSWEEYDRSLAQPHQLEILRILPVI